MHASCLSRRVHCLMHLVVGFIAYTAMAQSPDKDGLKEYGRIEWHGETATLFAGNVRPLDLAALTLSTCLGIPVSSEDPHYSYLGDLVDLSDNDRAIEHPVRQIYVPKPAELEVTFKVDSDGMPTDLIQLLEDATRQANQRQQFAYRVYQNGGPHQRLYSFIPTKSRDKQGNMENVPPYLDQKISIVSQTAAIRDVASAMTDALSEKSGKHFACCVPIELGHLWGEKVITYRAENQPTRRVLEDLLQSSGEIVSYALRCQPMDDHCFIAVRGVASRRKPAAAPRSGVCIASDMAK
jgi:hypothetical protein